MLTRCPLSLANALGCRGLDSPCGVVCFCTVAVWLAAVISGLLLLQQYLRGNEVDEREAHKDEHIKPQIGETECLVEGPDADRLEPGRRKCQADKPSLAGQGGHGNEQTGKVHRRDDRENGARE